MWMLTAAAAPAGAHHAGMPGSAIQHDRDNMRWPSNMH